MAGAFDIVMQERKDLVDKIIGMMQQGDFFHNASEWDREAFRSQNPLSVSGRMKELIKITGLYVARKSAFQNGLEGINDMPKRNRKTVDGRFLSMMNC